MGIRGSEGPHAEPARGLHRGMDLMDLRLPDQSPNRGRRDENLAGHDAAAALRPAKQRLGDDALEDVGELGAHLLLPV